MAKKIYEELQRKKIDPHLQDKDGKTPLIYAAEKNFTYIVKHLIKD
mgnify:CR=1 FL=1